jgi:hypothetical protein
MHWNGRALVGLNAMYVGKVRVHPGVPFCKYAEKEVLLYKVISLESHA